MNRDRIVVVSTQRNAGNRAKACLLSVSQQTEDHAHIFVDAGSSPENLALVESVVEECRHERRDDIWLMKRDQNKSVLENVHEIIHSLEPSAIVVWLDGDDHLPHPEVLTCIRRLYDTEDPWMTWGQFVYSDGRPGWASDYPAPIRVTRSYRNDVWRATHLRTFRAGLFQKIRKESLQRAVTFDELGFPPSGGAVAHAEWIEYATDLAVMFPMLEMAQERGVFFPLTLCVYTGSSQTSEGPGSPTWIEALRIRGLPKYERLQERPW